MYVLECEGYEHRRYYYVLDDNQDTDDAIKKIRDGEMVPFGSHLIDHGVGRIVRREWRELHDRAKSLEYEEE